jgi:cobalt-zinc-cadmium resistance protein CzcA
MFDNIISYSIKNKFVVGLLVLGLICWGIYSLKHLPIAAVPDITNNQVQILTVSPTLATEEIEQFITTPVEQTLQTIQQVVEIRSISRFGLSVVTVVFEERMNIYLARQLVGERLKEAAENIPEGLGTPELAPISTGLGEIYQYVVRAEPGFEDEYPLTELRSIQDWLVKRQLSGIEGVVEVNTLGGYLKQYEVAVRPRQLKSMGVSIIDIFDALENSNENTGGAYIEKTPNTYYVRSHGMAESLNDIENIVIDVRNGRPILIRDVATVQFGQAPRYGAASRDGAEVVSGTVMMLKGENSSAVIERIKKRMIQINKSLPEGVVVEPYLVRDKLVSMAIKTVKTNLIEGGLIVIFILVLMLGNWRAGLIVASVIPLAMLFAVSMMQLFGISANLMSLGAIDFGLIVDGAVIIVEAIIHRLSLGHAGRQLSQSQMDHEVKVGSIKIRNSAAFGEIIILMVYLPILALVGIEGKMFRPMAQTVMLAIAGALILSMTYVPMMLALTLNKKISTKRTWADHIILFCQRLYAPVLALALRFKTLFVLATVLLFAVSFFVFTRMGGEFIPTLEEGDLALHQILPPGSSLSQSVDISKLIQQKLIENFPEVEDVVTKIGSAEIPTDPMSVETGDIIVVMKPKNQWTSASTRYALFDKMANVLEDIPGVQYEFSQPIQMRFNELMTGSRADIAIKLFGEDLDILYAKAKEAEKLIKSIDGVGTTKVEQVNGMPQLIINYKYNKMAQYGLQVKDINKTIRAAFAGERAGIIYEGDRRYDLVVRLEESNRQGVADVKNLFISLDNGTQLPLSAVADVKLEDAPMQISRDDAHRRIVIGVNVGKTDTETLVSQIQNKLDDQINLPPGYYFSYGGQFENLKAANARLAIAVPLALALIFILLYFTFRSFSQALLIFTAIPLSAIGGIWALELRGMPFSISAGIGFIALFGVAVLNGIVLIGYFNQLKKDGMTDVKQRVLEGTRVRLRPVLLTAAVASLGFLPMALSNSGGAEVQRPLATVVIGGLITATFLTLVILPILYSWLSHWKERQKTKKINVALCMAFMAFSSVGLQAQVREISLDDAIDQILNQHPEIARADYSIKKYQAVQNLNYNPGITEIRYQGDGLFSANSQRVNQVNLVQNFSNPRKTKTLNEWQKELLSASELNKRLIENGLVRQVREIYLEVQFNKEVRTTYQDLISLYTTYTQLATKRVQLGEANQLESLLLRSKLQEYEMLLRQNKMEGSSLEEQLGLLLGQAGTLTSKDSFSLMRTTDSDESVDGLWRQQLEQNKAIIRTQIASARASTKPDFHLGYAAQNFYEGGWLSGIQAGIQIPLFTSQNKQMIQSQFVELDVIHSSYEADQLQRTIQQQAALNSINSYLQGVRFYQNQIETLNPELDRIATLNYRAGEISYMELLNTLNILTESKIHFIEQIRAHNQAAILYLYITAN